MSNVIIGGIPGFYIYFGRNATWKSGDPSSDKHQPLNPIVESVGITMPEAIYELIAPVSNLYPQINVDKQQEPTTITFRAYFREPFLMLNLFSHKELPSTWTGTSDTIAANFTTMDDVDNNISVQIKLPDPAAGGKDVTLFLDGGRIEEYRWIGEGQDAVFEEIDIKFAEVSDSDTACDIDDGFDDGAFDASGIDGGFAWWNKRFYTTKEAVLLTKDVTITIGTLAAGLRIQSWELIIPVPNAMEFVASSRVAGIVHNEIRGPWVLNLSGKLSGDDNIAQAFTTLSSKTSATAKLEYDSSPFDKYFQFTNAILKNIDGLTIPAAGESIDVTYNFEGKGSSALSYSWTDTEGDDPSGHITHTDI